MLFHFNSHCLTLAPPLLALKPRFLHVFVPKWYIRAFHVDFWRFSRMRDMDTDMCVCVVCIWSACYVSVLCANIHCSVYTDLIFLFSSSSLQYSWVTLHTSLCTALWVSRLQECFSLSLPLSPGSFWLNSVRTTALNSVFLAPHNVSSWNSLWSKLPSCYCFCLFVV